MKIVLDSNTLLIALGKNGDYRRIWDALLDGKYQLVISDEIIYEYIEVLENRAAQGATNVVMEIFLESPDVLFQKVYYSWNLIVQDPDDNKFFDIAVASNADYLVTNDNHFKIVKNLAFPSVKIISADEFLVVLEQG